ncbi:MAG: sulfatase [Acidobacteria bacterium]|nr:sulfatase [Acidobacteriota bacterium]
MRCTQHSHRRDFFKLLAGSAAGSFPISLSAAAPPNIVFILADDLGYGDLGCYGSNVSTPNIDSLARDGVLFRQFCAPSSVCSPSRAGFLTGRYGVRAGIPTVMNPTDTHGLGENETTIAGMLKKAGYRTAAIGKWHLGSQQRHMPCSRGFDEFFGLPYSNDQSPSMLMQNQDVLESPTRQDLLTERYTSQTIAFLRRNRSNPFFLFLSHTAPHIPLVPSRGFRGKSGLGAYADVLQELDWSVGEVLNELASSGMDRNTLVIFASDNGPWFQGSAGRTRGRKGDTFEGGIRVPFLARYPGRIPAGKVVNGFASGLDLLPTVAHLANVQIPSGLDGVDIWPMLTTDKASVDRPEFLYFDNYHLQCVRLGKWKLHLSRYNSPAYTPEPKVGRFNLPLTNPELYDIQSDPGESSDIADQHPEVVADLRERLQRVLADMPQKVRDAWEDTINRRVHQSASGAWPVPVIE